MTSHDEESRNEAPWVREMHEHFRETGNFRPSDVQRVLGDPRDSVGISGNGDQPAAALSKRR